MCLLLLGFHMMILLSMQLCKSSMSPHKQHQTHHARSLVRNESARLSAGNAAELHDVVVGQEIGRGGFGVVYVGTWNSCTVALKAISSCESPTKANTSKRKANKTTITVPPITATAVLTPRSRANFQLQLQGQTQVSSPRSRKTNELLAADERSRRSGGIDRPASVVLDDGDENASLDADEEQDDEEERPSLEDHEMLIHANIRHPNIIMLYGWTRLVNTRYLVMEYADGGSLQSLITYEANHGRLIPAPRIVRFAHEICSGLQSLHGWSPKIYHRDLKTDNILLVAGVAKISDFGLAKVSQSSKNRRTHIPGTVSWWAPEIIAHGEFLGEASDIYGFGLIVLTMLKGEVPHANRTMMEIFKIMQDNPQPHSIPPTAPHPLKTIVRLCLSPAHTDRPSIRNLYDALDRLLSDQKPLDDIHIDDCFPKARRFRSMQLYTSDELKALPLIRTQSFATKAISDADIDGTKLAECIDHKSRYDAQQTQADPYTRLAQLAQGLILDSEMKEDFRAIEILAARFFGDSSTLLRGLINYATQSTNDFASNLLLYIFYLENPKQILRPRNTDILVSLEKRLSECSDGMRARFEATLGYLTKKSGPFSTFRSDNKDTKSFLLLMSKFYDYYIKKASPEKEFLKKLSEYDNRYVLTYYALGMMESETNRPEIVKVEEKLKSAISRGSVPALYHLGMFYLNSAESRFQAQAVDMLLKASLEDHYLAQHRLGLLHEAGQHVAKSSREAYRYMLQAANAGYAPAQFTCGSYLKIGFGCIPSLENAFKYLRLAANQMHLEAQVYLAEMYQKGVGCDVDIEEAFDLYVLASEKKHPVAQRCLASFYQHGMVVERDMVRAFTLYELAARQGDIIAMSELGLMHYRGDPHPHNFRDAYEWLKKSAVESDPFAMHALSHLMWEGRGGVRDESNALHYLHCCLRLGHLDGFQFAKTIAEKDQPLAQLYVGEFIEKFSPPLHSIRDAVGWLARSAKNGLAAAHKNLIRLAGAGNSLARLNVGYCHEYGWVVSIDVHAAIENYYFALIEGESQGLQELIRLSEAAVPRAQYYLALANKQGVGKQPDREAAISYFVSSALSGEARSIPLLREYSDEGDPRSSICLGELFEMGKVCPQVLYVAANYYMIAWEAGCDRAINRLEFLAQSRNIRSLLLLAKIYMEGIRVPEDVEKAIQYLVAALNLGSDEAFQMIKKLAFDGNKNAIYWIAMSLSLHDYSTVDKAQVADLLHTAATLGSLQAFEALRELAQDGNAYSWQLLGVCHYNGIMTQIDESAAFECYLKAAQLKDQKSMIDVAVCYEVGMGTDKNISAALYWYGQALRAGVGNAFKSILSLATKGEREAQYWCGEFYSKHNVDGSRQWELAHSWLQQSADQDYALAHVLLGNFYRKGWGCCRDLAQAREHFTLAAKLNCREGYLGLVALADASDRHALHQVGLCHIRGWSVEVDAEAAVPPLRKSMRMQLFDSFQQLLELAQSGLVSAIMCVGEAYELGYCLKQNWDECVEWYHLAATKSSAAGYERLCDLERRKVCKAILSLGSLYEEGVYVKHDLVVAAEKYFKCATLGMQSGYQKLDSLAKSGIAFAMYYLGACSEGNFCVNQDKHLACKHYRDAASTGHSQAISRLAELSEEGLDLAMLYLGECYELGLDQSGAREDIASFWYMSAARAGLKEGLDALILLSEKPVPVAVYHLGLCHESAFCTTQDLRAAVDCYSKSYILGYANAVSQIERLALAEDPYAMSGLAYIHAQNHKSGHNLQNSSIQSAIHLYQRASLLGESKDGVKGFLECTGFHDMDYRELVCVGKRLGLDFQGEDGSYSGLESKLIDPSPSFYLGSFEISQQEGSYSVILPRINSGIVATPENCFVVFCGALNLLSLEEYEQAHTIVEQCLEISPSHYGCLLLKRILYILCPSLLHPPYETQETERLDFAIKAERDSSVHFGKMMTDLYTQYRSVRSKWGVVCTSFYGEYLISLESRASEAIDCFLEAFSYGDSWAAYRMLDVYSQSSFRQTKSLWSTGALQRIFTKEHPCIMRFVVDLPPLNDGENQAEKLIQQLHTASHQGDIPSMMKLGEILTNGSLVPQNLARAVDYFALASSYGHQPATISLVNIAQGTSEAADYALKKLRNLASLGLSHVQYRLGECLAKQAGGSLAGMIYSGMSDSQLTDSNITISDAKEEKMIDTLNSGGPDSLSFTCDATRLTEGCFWYRCAAEKGLESALNSLLSLCRQDVAPALSAVGRMLEQGFVAARSGLMDLARSGHEKALVVLGDASRKANTYALSALEELIMEGSKAAFSYLLSFANGRLETQGMVTRIYDCGPADLRDSRLAAAWVLKSALMGHLPSQVLYGDRLSKGVGVSVDLEAACDWYRRAASKGNEQGLARLLSLSSESHGCASYTMAMMYLSGDGVVESQPEMGVSMLQKACQQSYAKAFTELGRCYSDGRGVQKDQDRAIALLRQAVENGDDSAVKHLALLDKSIETQREAA
eukprot:TRINITY_DN6914_c0_g1_i2.p2 TRINITY_DN6914_c0_g1~~TRINITY_DN6914_c0_g1_i2.p2  ORF type:complete len:2480 (-),score=441.98 TRINITY_DN6914_c0_g1_i2:256-7695(-)